MLRTLSNNTNAPFIAGSLPDFLQKSGYHPFVKQINKQIELAISQTEKCHLVFLGDLEDIGDKVHFSTSSLNEMGERYAKEFIKSQRVNDGTDS